MYLAIPTDLERWLLRLVPKHLENEEVARQLELRFGTLQDGIYARLVEKVGDKMYWENWAKSVGEIAQKFIERIALLIKENDNARNYFKEFISGLHKNINDGIDGGQAIEMLAQHLITRSGVQCAIQRNTSSSTTMP